ncbi:DUF882 domain-containing protein [Pararhizobium haloflavum]|uniref:DUF882 domain-containing protein n=1 Tax=Pararhizobium haloflavum TaxID=2037914 RepID=UPI000C1A5F0A|nr:DUF882 domain-containing protein [Pararhizobium haloflavum]
MAAFVATVFTLGTTGAQAQTRSLKIHFTHTKERAEITFKKNGRFVQSGLDQLNHILRDWRRNEPTKMDPRLFDLLWEVYQASGSRDYIYVVSAYRSPKTNNMLRSRSSGVAKNSQHTLGKAMDFFLPDVSISKIRELGMKFQVGGVGYYPNSGSPFVHLDVGSVRAWPRMSRQQLASLFPDGKTLHLPPDGRKLAGYDQALADYKRRVGASGIEVAGGGAGDGSSGNRRNLLAMLFGNNGDEDEDATAIASSAPQPQAQPAAVQQPTPPQPAPQRALASVLPASRSAPIPVNRPVIGQVPPPQVAALALVGETTPPPAASLAAATLPAPTPESEVAEVQPEAKPEFVDLAAYSVPVPEFLADRSGISVFAADDAPAFEGRDVTDVLMAEASIEPDGQSALQTALAPVPADRPQMASLRAASGDGSAEDSGQAGSDVAGNGAASDARSSGGEVTQPVEMAALDPSSSAPAANGALAERMASTLGNTPLKGGRPTAADARRTEPKAVRTEPDLTETMVSDWAISQTRLATVTEPVKSPRFVNKALRAAPETVYTTGFSATTVEANRFTGAAVNFLSVARFAKAD